MFLIPLLTHIISLPDLLATVERAPKTKRDVINGTDSIACLQVRNPEERG